MYVCGFVFSLLCVGNSTVTFILLYKHMWFVVGTNTSCHCNVSVAMLAAQPATHVPPSYHCCTEPFLLMQLAMQRTIHKFGRVRKWSSQTCFRYVICIIINTHKVALSLNFLYTSSANGISKSNTNNRGVTRCARTTVYGNASSL